MQQQHVASFTAEHPATRFREAGQTKTKKDISPRHPTTSADDDQRHDCLTSPREDTSEEKEKRWTEGNY